MEQRAKHILAVLDLPRQLPLLPFGVTLPPPVTCLLLSCTNGMGRGNKKDGSRKQVSEGVEMKFKIPPERLCYKTIHAFLAKSEMETIPIEVQSYKAQHRERTLGRGVPCTGF